MVGGLRGAGQGSTAVAADVMWSDPSADPGLHANDSRGVGCIFGPDITEVECRSANCAQRQSASCELLRPHDVQVAASVQLHWWNVSVVVTALLLLLLAQG